MAAVPDFGSLAAQQSTANNAATNATNLANRPNQTGPMGSSTWSMNPDGTWTNNTSLSPDAGFMFNQSIQGQNNLDAQIGQGVNFGSLPTMPQVGGYSQPVIDAWNALAQPGLDQTSAAARTRAAAQGITLGSNASNDVERDIGTNEATQRNQAILQGYQQGNTEYTQAMQARQQAEKEAMDKYSSAISGTTTLGNVRDSYNPNSWLAKTPTSAAYTPQNIYGAALDTFSANQANENAAQAQSNANRSATTSAVTGGLSALGGYKGLSSLGSDLWSGANSLWNWASGSTPTQSYNPYNVPADDYNDNSSFWATSGSAGSNP